MHMARVITANGLFFFTNVSSVLTGLCAKSLYDEVSFGYRLRDMTSESGNSAYLDVACLRYRCRDLANKLDVSALANF